MELSGTPYWLNEREKIQKEMEDIVAHYRAVAAKYKGWHTHFQMLCSGMGAASTVLSSSGLATSFTGAGMVVSGPLIAIALLLTMVSTSISLNIRLVMCKAKKRERLGQTLWKYLWKKEVYFTDLEVCALKWLIRFSR